MRRIQQIAVAFLLFLVVPGTSGFTTEVEIRPFELLTRGRLVDDVFELQTVGDIGLTLRSGFLAQPSVTLGFESPGGFQPVNQADPTTTLDPELRSASVSVREVFGTDLSVSYFIGESDRLGSGQAFPQRFDTLPVATQFRGFRYFPDGPRYEGPYGVEGTGLSIHSNDRWNRTEISAYTYQDSRFEPGVFSSDLNLMLAYDTVQFEGFVGATYPRGDFGRYRAGILANLVAAEGDSLLLQAALPAIEPGDGETIGVEDFFFLFEPRVRIGVLRSAVTFFWRPDIYDQEPTDAGGTVDSNIRLQIGDTRTGPVAGGVETRLTVAPDGADQISANATPFVQFDTGGVTWDFRTRLNVLQAGDEELFETFLGVRTEY